MTANRSITSDTGFRPAVFFATLIVFLSVVFALQLMPLRNDIFSDAETGSRALVDGLSASDIAALKKLHSERVPPYSIGLFGNSRILDVSSEDAGRSRDEFFNFAISGASIRQTAVFLDILNSIGKTPKTIVISVDNFELQLFANPEYPMPPMRWLSVLGDLHLAVVGRDIAPADRARIVWRHAYNEWQWFTGIFNIKRLYNRLLLESGAARGTPAPYRGDGSRTPPVTSSSAMPDILPPGRSMVIDGLLNADLARLAPILRSGARVIIYESPLEPRSADVYWKSPSPFSIQLRERMARAAAEMGFEWYSAHMWRDNDHLPWRDSNHPPAKALGLYIIALIDNTLQQ